LHGKMQTASDSDADAGDKHSDRWKNQARLAAERRNQFKHSIV